MECNGKKPNLLFSLVLELDFVLLKQNVADMQLHLNPIFALWREGATPFLHTLPDPFYFTGPTSHLGGGGGEKTTWTQTNFKHDFHYIFDGKTTKMRKPKTQSTSPPNLLHDRAYFIRQAGTRKDRMARCGT